MVKLPDKLPGERLLIKILGSGEAAVSALNRRWLYRADELNKAKVDAEALRIRKLAGLQLRQDIAAIKRGEMGLGSDYGVVPVEDKSMSEAALVTRAKDEFLRSVEDAGINPKNLIEVERKLNLDQIELKMVELALENVPDTDEKIVQPDWFVQWRNCAQDVSDDDMQVLWAKVRLGEISKAGSYGIRALQFLGSMSREDADLIAKLAPFVVDRGYLFRASRDYFDAAELHYGNFLYLEEIGVLNGVQGHTQSRLFVREHDDGYVASCRVCNNMVVAFSKTRPTPDIAVDAYPITSVGRELLKLVEPGEADISYLRMLAGHIKPRAETVKIVRIISEQAGVANIEDVEDV